MDKHCVPTLGVSTSCVRQAPISNNHYKALVNSVASVFQESLAFLQTNSYITVQDFQLSLFHSIMPKANCQCYQVSDFKLA